MHSACFGISGDRTENVLWRLQNGELEDVSPKIIVLSVGQENYGDSPEAIVEGVKAICGFIRSKQPQAFLVLLVRRYQTTLDLTQTQISRFPDSSSSRGAQQSSEDEECGSESVDGRLRQGEQSSSARQHRHWLCAGSASARPVRPSPSV